MSAYLVQPHHAAYLARYYVDHCQKWGAVPGAPSDVADVAELLARANMASIIARYDDRYDHDPATYVSECRRAAMLAHWPKFDPVELFKASQCFDYQACEVDDYDQTTAAAITRRIRSTATHDLLGYDAAPWGAPEPMAKRSQPAPVTRTVPSLAALATPAAPSKGRKHGLHIVR